MRELLSWIIFLFFCRALKKKGEREVDPSVIFFYVFSSFARTGKQGVTLLVGDTEHPT